MSPVPCFSEEQIEALARVLGECGTGSDISRALGNCGFVDNSGQSTKWRRLEWAFLESQRHYQCANQVLNFIRSFLIPVRFAGQSDEFEMHRQKLNVILAFSGIEYGQDGNFRRQEVAKTLDEAEERVKTIQAKFRGRRMHPKVLNYCRTELLQDNYFHAVFEASKGLAQRIRDISGIQADGTALVDRVFSIKQPVLVFNTLQTETERSEHKGFANLLRGCFGAIRNPLAHEPKTMWEDEDDAADYLSLISLLHRKLDDCVPTGTGDTK